MERARDAVSTGGPSGASLDAGQRVGWVLIRTLVWLLLCSGFRSGSSGGGSFLGFDLAAELFVDVADSHVAGVALFELGDRSEQAEVGVEVDLFDGLGKDAVLAAAVVDDRARLAGQVDARDLEAVEQQAGAFGVEFVGGDALQHLADGDLDGETIRRSGEGEGALLGLSLGECAGRDGSARGVVVVAERLAAKARAAAAVAVGVDVAALEALGRVGVVLDAEVGLVHDVCPPPPGYFS